MVRLTRCKKCDKLLSTIQDVSKYGDHGWKFSCCKTEYYQCNRESCNHGNKERLMFFYQRLSHLETHIEHFHCHKEQSNPNNLDDYMPTSTVSTSYQESSSLQKYFNENHCMEEKSFPYEHQRDAIKKIITMACSKKGGVISLSRRISNSSFTVFFAIAQIAFIANDVVLKYLSIILSLVIPLWRNTYLCQLEIPTTPDEIRKIITSTNKFSIRSLIPMPSIEEVQDHCYSSLLSLLAYTTMTSDNNSQAKKSRYKAWMKSKTCTTFSEKVDNLTKTSERPSVAVFMVFWSDGFDPNNSMKRNRHSVWILTVTFFFFDITRGELYLVESCLLAMGPGKGAAEAKEDHSCIFEKLRYDIEAVHNNFDGNPIPFSFASRAHKGDLCDFYVCSEIYFSTSFTSSNSNIHIMDNPERRANFGLLAGNSHQHAYFGLSCHFGALQLQFHACKKCTRDIIKYCKNEGWMDGKPPRPKCKTCHGFSVEHLLEQGKYKKPLYTPPATIDELELPGHHLFYKPGKINNNLLIDAYISARDFFLAGEMSKASVEGYLSTLCFNSSTIEDLISQCRLYQLSRDVENGCNDISADDRLVVARAKEKSPNNSIEKPSPPPLLYICNLDCSIETIMHLGMNVSKHCEHATFNWAKDIPGFSCAELIEETQQYLKVIDKLKVAAFPVMQFKTDSMGGYVAENHRAYMQLAPWIFRWINQYKDDRQRNWIQELQLNNLESWTRKEMYAYLQLRGVSFNRRSLKSELHKMVKASSNLPELQTFETFSGSDMRQMMSVLNSFLSALFAMDITGQKARNRLSSIARLYLCFSTRLDNFLLKKTPSWLSTFSLLGMLRVVDTFQIAPYPICFYEGDGMGEGIVKEIRPILMSGLRKGWTMAGHGTHYRMKTLAYMQDMLLSKATMDMARTTKRPVRPDTKVYRFCADVEHAIENQNAFAFSLFENILSHERVIAIIICYLKQYYIRILHVASKQKFQDPHGFAYFHTNIHPKIEHSVIDIDNLQSQTLTHIASGIALPSLQQNTYAFVLGNGEKKVPGDNHTFSPTTINKRYTPTNNQLISNRSVLL